MLIDWFTVAAQGVNFLVLVWLLKRFLYKPVLDAIAAREKRIADQIADAAAKEAEAQKEQGNFQKKNDEFESQKARLMEETRKEAKEIHQQLLKEARAEADSLRAGNAEALSNQHYTLVHEIIQRTREEVFALTAKVLRDLADTDIEERMIAVFIRHMKALAPEEKHKLLSIPADASDIFVTSAFTLQPAQQDAIKTAVRDIMGSTADKLRFKAIPDLISGIELSLGGHKLAWSIGDYLATLEKSIGEATEKASALPEVAHAA